MSAAKSATNQETPSDNSPDTAPTAELKSFPRGEDTARKPDASAETVEATPAADEPKRPGRRRMLLAGIALLALAGAGWYGYDWWTVGRFMVSTDNAYVGGDIATISPKVSGYIKKVLVANNQHVKAGDPLVTLDDGDYRIAADQAKAQIATQELTLKRIDAQIGGAQAALAQAKAQQEALAAAETNAKAALTRAKALNSDGHASGATLDAAEAAWEQAKANLSGAAAGIQAADANIAVLRAQRAEAESALTSMQLAADKADRDLSFTVLHAPYDGIIGNLDMQEGDLVNTGQRLAALVPVNGLYVDANFKETQLAGIRPGEKVAIHIDAYEDEPIEGTVVSISPATGSVFSLLPANNATGNFTKVVQRVPVRIALPAKAVEEGRLRAGLSVVVDIDTRTGGQTVDTASAE
ncbi:MAG: hemolysin D [Ahrensia sp.]|nr:hemolysin D [Ahrensia sp.]